MFWVFFNPVTLNLTNYGNQGYFDNNPENTFLIKFIEFGVFVGISDRPTILCLFSRQSFYVFWRCFNLDSKLDKKNLTKLLGCTTENWKTIILVVWWRKSWWFLGNFTAITVCQFFWEISEHLINSNPNISVSNWVWYELSPKVVFLGIWWLHENVDNSLRVDFKINECERRWRMGVISLSVLRFW